MGRSQGANQHRSFSTVNGVLWGVSIAAAAAVLLSIVLLFASVQQADRLAVDQQRTLIGNALAQSIERVAHDQESSTTWTEAARQVASPALDYDWLDGNLGVWFYTYYGHDEVFILDPAGRPVYAMQSGHRAAPTSFDDQVAPVAAPLVARLRQQLRLHPPATGTSLSAGRADFAIVGGRPAIVSVKPIIPERGSVAKGLDAGFMHVSVVYLDGGFAQSLNRDFQIKDPVFLATSPSNMPSVPFRSRSGHVLGYLAWSPFEPGTLISRDTVPVMACATILVGTIIFFLLRRLCGRTIELHASEAQARYFASHDPLTGLANRSLFHDRVRRELASPRRDGLQIAYLNLNLDGFKGVNDTFGHSIGDDLIRIVAGEIGAAIAQEDAVARIGGDEFAILQTGVRGPAEVEALCKRLTALFGSLFHVGETTVSVGVSIGVALAGRDPVDATELARKADIAMYEAKAAGGGWAFFSPAMDASRRGRREMEADLRAALESGDQLTIHYQPIFAARGLEPTGVEALARWRHPTRGWIDPGTFILLADECGLIEELGAWVLRETCGAARNWAIETVAVNASAGQLRNPDYADQVLATLAEAGLPPDRLEIEVTETALIDNAGASSLNIEKLHAHGVGIVLDDFGTGYSSFSNLNGFAVDRIKIDRSFVAASGPGGEGQSIVRWIVNIARASGIKVTAEGVETREQQLFLSRIGCTDLQGNFLAEAMPAEQLSDLLATSGGKPRSPRRRARMVASRPI